MEKYNSNLPYSYVFGAFGTIMMLENKANECKGVLVDPSFKDNDAMDKIKSICKQNNIPITIDLKAIEKIRDKKNIYVIGVFNKYKSTLNEKKHIALYQINDVGMIGTIIRSMQGFDYVDLALIDCNVDIYHEHLIRSTMGAFFRCNVNTFDSIDDYINKYKNLTFYNVSIGGNDVSCIKKDVNTSLIFSNKSINHKNIINIRFNEDIPLENIVNIVLFKMYK